MKRIFLVMTMMAMAFLLNAQDDHGKNMVYVTIDNVSFEESGKLNVLDNENNLIVQFDRFENKNIPNLRILNTRVYSPEGDLLMTIVVNFDQPKVQLHLLNAERKRGLIDVVSKAGDGSLSTQIKVDFFTKDYSLTHTTTMGKGNFETEKKLSYGSKLVMQKKRKFAGGVLVGDLLVDQNYLKDNREEAGIWSIIFMMLWELGT